MKNIFKSVGLFPAKKSKWIRILIVLCKYSLNGRKGVWLIPEPLIQQFGIEEIQKYIKKNQKIKKFRGSNLMILGYEIHYVRHPTLRDALKLAKGNF
jgi:hypothetical protein